MRLDIYHKLEMSSCKFVYASPERPNIYYEVLPRTEISKDIQPLVDNLRLCKQMMPSVIVYCRSLNLCSDLYAFFLTSLREHSYYPLGAQQVSDNRLFGMFHAHTPAHNKQVILESMKKPNGVVRVVFALGMGVDFVGLNRIIHYGAPSSMDDYYQESGRAGRMGDNATSTIYWKPSDAPLKKELSDPKNRDIVSVRKYLENSQDCRRIQLLSYFDDKLCESIVCTDKLLCCDVCAKKECNL